MLETASGLFAGPIALQHARHRELAMTEQDAAKSFFNSHSKSRTALLILSASLRARPMWRYT
jgi:hypothetical protein